MKKIALTLSLFCFFRTQASAESNPWTQTSHSESPFKRRKVHGGSRWRKSFGYSSEMPTSERYQPREHSAHYAKRLKERGFSSEDITAMHEHKDRIRKMSDEEREAKRANMLSTPFSMLPNEKQAHLNRIATKMGISGEELYSQKQERMREMESMSSEQRSEMRAQMRKMHSMTPEQRSEMRTQMQNGDGKDMMPMMRGMFGHGAHRARRSKTAHRPTYSHDAGY